MIINKGTTLNKDYSTLDIPLTALQDDLEHHNMTGK